jgi:hypothetical protein
VKLFHRHQFELVAKTYSAPKARIHDFKNVNDNTGTLERMLHGVTSFVWKCKDENCAKTIVEQALGKEGDK